MTFRPMQFQPMQFQPLSFQTLTISTYCIFNLPQFRPILILANYSNSVEIISVKYLVMNQTTLIIDKYSWRSQNVMKTGVKISTFEFRNV